MESLEFAMATFSMLNVQKFKPQTQTFRNLTMHEFDQNRIKRFYIIRRAGGGGVLWVCAWDALRFYFSIA